MFKVAKVTVPIALDKEFDYCFSPELKIKMGVRVAIDFRGKKQVGFVTGLSRTSKLKKLKPIIDLLDEEPFLNRERIEFADRLSEIYPYARGEFLFMMLPPSLKKMRKTESNFDHRIRTKEKTTHPEKVFIKADRFLERYQTWRDLAAEKLKTGSVLICFPQLTYLLRAKQILEKDFSHKINLLYSQEKEKDFFLNWRQTRGSALILGTRTSIFYYPNDLNLIIIEEENSPYYFQEEKPFYNLLEVAHLLSRMKKVDLVLSGDYPTLSTYKLIKDKEISLLEESRNSKSAAQEGIKIVSTVEFGKKKLISPVL